MLTLYYSPGACSLAAHIALEEAGAAYAAERVAILDGDHRCPEFLSINPRGRVPVLAVDDVIVTENTAILAYIGHCFPDSLLLPLDDVLALARAHELLSFFSSSVHIAFAQFWRMERFSDDASLHDAIREGGRRAILRYFDEIEALAAAGEWLVSGRFSAADTYPFVFYRWGQRIGVDMTAYSNWTAHTARMLGRPAVGRAITQEGLSRTEFIAEGAAAC